MSPHLPDYCRSFVIDIFPRHIVKLKTDTIKRSLESGFSPDSYLGDEFCTGLHLAAEHEEEADAITVAEILLKYGANPNIQRGLDGRTSLHIAALMGHMRLLDLLMCNGGDPLRGDIKGMSVVDLASSSDHPEVVSHINQILNTETYHTQVEEEKFTLSFKSKEVVDVLIDPQSSLSEYSFHTATENEDNRMDKKTVDSFDGLISPTDQHVAAWCNNMCKNFQSISRTDSIVSDVDPLRKCLIKALMRKDSKSSQGSSDIEEELFSSVQEDIDLTIYKEAEDILQSRTLVEDSYLSNEETSCMYVEQSDSPLDMAHLDDITQNTSFELTNINNTAVFGVDTTHCKYNRFGNKEGRRQCTQNTRENKENIFRMNNFKLPNTPKSLQRNLKGTFASTITVNSSGPPSTITVSSTKSITSIIEEYIYNDAEAGVSLIERRCPSLAKISSFNGTGTLKSTTSVNSFTAKESLLLQAQDLTTESKLKDTATPSHLSRERWGPNGTPLSILDQPYIPSTPFPNVDRLGPMGTPLSFLDVANPWHIPKSPIPHWKNAPSTQFWTTQSDNKFPVHLLKPTANVKISITQPTPITKEKMIGKISNKKETLLEKNNETACSNSTIGTVTDSIAQMSVNELKRQLQCCGMTNIGPILPCTQRIYQRHLLKLRKYPDMALASKNDKEVIYPREIKLAIEERGNPDWPSWAELEQIMCAPFNNIDPSRHWRDGNGKTCFNYLLLDPRITQELPLRCLSMSEAEKMKSFISSIFYIGKGSRGRPYHHMYEAIKDSENKNNPLNNGEHRKKKTKKNKKYDSSAKIQRIQEIWEDGLGVVSLHVFQNTIPVEAWTREAAMISAVGLDNLTNSCHGTFYGPASTWKGGRRRQLGAHLLHLALNIMMFEGERQLRPNDVPLPAWWK